MLRYGDVIQKSKRRGLEVMEVYDTHISPGKNSAVHAGPQGETPGSVMRWRGEESGNWGSRNQRKC